MSTSSLSFATVDPKTLSGKNPVQLYNLVGGEWVLPKESKMIQDPLNGEEFIKVPNPQLDELQPYIDSLSSCPKTGLHNPFKNVERYRLYGEISAKAANMLHDKDVEDFFARLIQRVMPKSYAQALGEVKVVRTFLENFSGDQVRFLARGFSNPGDHIGQRSTGYRWPYGPVAIISPFNFPLEIPALQLMGALYMGNKVLIKNATTTCIVIEQFIRMLHECGLPKTDVDLIHCSGRVMGELVKKLPIRSLQFTGSSAVAEELSKTMNGKIFIEDSGFDWKILGADAEEHNLDYVAWQCDQDAYAASGQKCSAQSILFAHTNWIKLGLLDKLEELAKRRKVEDLTLGPILTESTNHMLNHAKKLLEIEGAKLLFGGRELEGHSFASYCGAIEPTAIFIPLKELLKPENFKLACTEIFGPFQIITEWQDDEKKYVLEACERMEQHLTAAVVSNDIQFVQEVIAHTVNGTTYVGLRGRTTGAPQNHWFGPAGDPRSAGIGTPEAIKLVWSCHREVIEDFGPQPNGWTIPDPS